MALYKLARYSILGIRPRVYKPTIFFIENISFSLKLFSGHLYGQSFIKTVSYETAPKVKLTFHPRPLNLDNLIAYSENTGLFELKFHMEYNTIQ